MSTYSGTQEPASSFWQGRLPPGVVSFQLPVDDQPIPFADCANPNSVAWCSVGQLIGPRDTPLIDGPFPGEGASEREQRLVLEAELQTLGALDHQSARIRENEAQRQALRQWCHYRPYIRFFTDVLRLQVCKAEASDFTFKISLTGTGHASRLRDRFPDLSTQEMLERVVTTLFQVCSVNFRFRYDTKSTTVTVSHQQFVRRGWSEQTIMRELASAFQVPSSCFHVKKFPPVLHLGFSTAAEVDSLSKILPSYVYMCDQNYHMWYATSPDANEQLRQMCCDVSSGAARKVCDDLRRCGLPRCPVAVEPRLKRDSALQATQRVSDLLLRSSIVPHAAVPMLSSSEDSSSPAWENKSVLPSPHVPPVFPPHEVSKSATALFAPPLPLHSSVGLMTEVRVGTVHRATRPAVITPSPCVNSYSAHAQNVSMGHNTFVGGVVSSTPQPPPSNRYSCQCTSCVASGTYSSHLCV